MKDALVGAAVAAAIVLAGAVVYHLAKRAEYAAETARQDSTIHVLRDSAESSSQKAEASLERLAMLSEIVARTRDTLAGTRRELVRERRAATDRELLFSDSLEAVLDAEQLPLLEAMIAADREEDAAYEAEIATLERDTVLLRQEIFEARVTIADFQAAANRWRAAADTLQVQRDYWRSEATSGLSISLPFGLDLRPGVTCGYGARSEGADCAAGVTLTF